MDTFNLPKPLVFQGNLIIGETGVLVGDVNNMQNMLIDGKVVGNISVEKLELHAKVLAAGNFELRCQPEHVLI